MMTMIMRPTIEPAAARTTPRSPLHAAGATSSRSTPRSAEVVRKRTASIEDDADLEHFRTLNNQSQNYNAATMLPRMLPDGPREHVCLCQPDPKIPRPRNAFILYRQHYQTQVIAQNPGLSNPDISKIIGERWRDESPDVKGEWKRLAEEEKQRHQRQYPDYRYQPRRSGKAGTPKSATSPQDATRCPKCKGQYIVTPGTPMTPITQPSSAQRTGGERALPSLPPQAPHNILPARPRLTDPRNAMSPPAETPVTASRRPLRSSMQAQAAARDDYDRAASLSPDAKRRRIHDEARRAHRPPHLPPQTSRSPWPPGLHDVRDAAHTLPEPSGLALRSAIVGGTMEPPPRTLPVMASGMRDPFEESLRLPPLKTHLSYPPTAVHGPDAGRRSSREIQARSVAAMVMSIPILNKVKVLARIAPPLHSPGPTSPAHECRGLLIAVEGSYAPLVTAVGKMLEEYLSREPECYLRTWQSSASAQPSPREPSEEAQTGSPERAKDAMEISPLPSPVTAAQPLTPTPTDPFPTYLEEIQTWHAKSREMVKFITSTPPELQRRAASPTSLPRSGQQQSRVPIALCPAGYSLSLSDRFSSQIPINDSYAPVDHWQWMATLWRGIIGPDLTIYVKPVPSPSAGRDPNAHRPNSAPAPAVTSAGTVTSTSTSSSNSISSLDEIMRYGAVEILRDPNAIIVRIPVPADLPLDNDATLPADLVIEERTLRRLGFEVLEMVRSHPFPTAPAASNTYGRI